MSSFAVPDAPSALDLAADIRTGVLDPVEAVERALARIAAVDGWLGAFVAVDADGRCWAASRSVPCTGYRSA
jgi:Asp-tRNA(Asn)/Glu-tRNA(Gln) amidotransferase A subunit family amidase